MIYQNLEKEKEREAALGMSKNADAFFSCFTFPERKVQHREA